MHYLFDCTSFLFQGFFVGIFCVPCFAWWTGILEACCSFLPWIFTFYPCTTAKIVAHLGGGIGTPVGSLKMDLPFITRGVVTNISCRSLHQWVDCHMGRHTNARALSFFSFCRHCGMMSHGGFIQHFFPLHVFPNALPLLFGSTLQLQYCWH